MSGKEKSPGQVACEAFWAYMGTGPDGQPPSAAWDWARSQGAQGAWMAASQAAVEATGEIRRGAALEAILALHRPIKYGTSTVCRRDRLSWPCLEVRAITSALTGTPQLSEDEGHG